MDEKYAKYLLDKTKNDYNLIAQDFSRTRGNIWEEIKFLFDDYLTAGEKVLDLGCGNGRFYETFKNKDIQYFGLDASEKLIEIAKKKYPKADFRTGEALKIPFPNNYFNKVYSIAVLHHIPSKELRINFLKEAKRILRPNGKMILTVWKLNNRSLLLKYTILKIFGKNKMDFKDTLEPWAQKTERYYHWFSKKELVKLIKQTGFRIENIGVIKNKTGNRKNIYLIAAK
jgi:ubiquinone/menaquinone biosynthesis C-methylase UbiE